MPELMNPMAVMTPHQVAEMVLSLCQLECIADAWCWQGQQAQRPTLLIFWVPTVNFKLPSVNELKACYQSWQTQLNWSGDVIWTAINRLPYTPDGKIDQAALLALPIWSLADQTDWQQQAGRAWIRATIHQDASHQTTETVPLAVTLVAHQAFGRSLVLRDYLPLSTQMIGSQASNSPSFAGTSNSTTDIAFAREGNTREVSVSLSDVRLSLSAGPTCSVPVSDRPPHLPALLARLKEPGLKHWSFYDAQGGVETCVPAQLPAIAEQWAKRLLAAGLVAGTPVILQLRSRWQFVQIFWGCQLAGLLPVPVGAPPSYAMASAELKHVQNVAGKLKAGAMILDDVDGTEARLWQSRNSLAGFNLLTLGELQSFPENKNDAVNLPTDFAAEAPAILMFTSGSTGNPKGVPLTHRQLVLRILCTIEVERLTRESISLNWMPLDHVAGLLMSHLRDVAMGCQQIVVTTEYILEDPLRWMILIDRHRVSTTFAPNFAYNLVMDHAERFADYCWDLSCVHNFLDGGEAVVPHTARRFLEGLAHFGLASSVLWPAWGMSETCSGVTYNRRFSLADLSASAQTVSVGLPFPDTQIRVVDAYDQLLPEGQEGRLQVAGGMVFNGYWEAPELTAESFTQNGWFRTGDLARIVEGELTITGRDKDVIIINGVNYSGTAIEMAVDQIAGVETSFTAACAVKDNEGKEHLALFFVPKSQQPEALRQVLADIRRVMQAEVGLQPEFMLPVNETDIPKTSIGKIQRTQLKNAFMAGQFQASQDRTDRLEGNARTLPNWFMQRVWQAQPLASQRFLGVLPSVTPTPRVGVTGLSKDQFAQLPQSVDWQWLDDFADLAHSQNQNLQGIVDARFLALAAGEVSEALLIQCWRQLINSATQLDRFAQNQNRRQPLAWWVFTQQAYRLPIDRVLQDRDPRQSAALAVAVWVQTLTQTLTSVTARHVDAQVLDVEVIGTEVNDFFVSQHLSLPSIPSSATRAWRQNNGNLQSYVPAMIEVTPTVQPAVSRLHKPGALLISGALGGLGQQLVIYLLTQTSAPLMLLGRRAEGEAVRQLLDSLSEQAAGLDIDKRYAYRARLIYLQSDLTDGATLATQLKSLLHNTTLAGIFHLAGQYRECLLAEETAADLQALLQPKISGTLTLLALLKTYPQAYVMGFSSVVALLGGSTLGGYAAANAYLDALLEDYAAQGYDCLSLQWASWRNQGLSQVHADSLGLQPEILAARGVASMALQPALASLAVALQQLPQDLSTHTLAIGLYADHAENRLMVNAVQPCLQIQAYVAESLLPTGQLPDLRLTDALGKDVRLPVLWLPSLPLTATGDIDYVALAEQAKPTREVRLPQNALEHQLLAFWRLCLKQNDISVTDAFFAVGGQSLLAMRLLGMINAEFGVNWSLPQLLRHSNIAAQAVAIAALKPAVSNEANVDSPSASSAPTSGHVPIPRQTQPCEGLSDAQQRIWLVSQMDPQSRVFNVPAQIILDEHIDVARAQAALDRLWLRHDALRCVFPLDQHSGQPKAQWLDWPQWPLDIIEVAQDIDWIAYTREFSMLPFDLQTGPLCRAQLLITPNGHGRLLLSLHHIITDGWSMKVIFDEWRKSYDHPQEDLPSLPIAYADYVAWNAAQQQSQQLQADLDYWQQQLKGGEQGFTLPTDFPHPQVQGYHGKTLHQFLPTSLADSLRGLAQKQQVSPFVLFLAAYKVLLARYSQQQDIILGIMIANRERTELADLVGMFVNPLVLRSQYDGSCSFVEWMDRVQQVSWQAYEHHHVPFEQVVERLKLPRDTARAPLFQMAFDYRDPQIVLSPRAGMRLQVMEPDLNVVQFDLQLTLQERDQGLELSWHWNRDLFTDVTIGQLAANYQQLLTSISHEPLKPLRELTLVTPLQQQQLKRYGQNPQAYPVYANFVTLFKQQVHNQPQQIAVEMGDQQLTYAQLDQSSDQWAQHLQQLGVQRGDLVGVCLPPVLDRVIAVLAVLKVAAAYLPLDPYYPAERLNYMLADAQAAWLIDDAHSASELDIDKLQRITTEQLADIPSPPAPRPQGERGAKAGEVVRNAELLRPLAGELAQPDDLAYMIYTSGSTGKPKGVRVPHRGWVNVGLAQHQVLGMQPGLRVLQFAAFSFDAAAFELALALGNGGTLCIAMREQLLPGADLYHTFKNLQIQIAVLASTALLAMPADDLPDLKIIGVAGEACPQALPRRFAHGRRFFNLYGPTETTIWASYFEASADADQAPPIGKPVPNDELWVLDAHQQLLPPGMPGMLYIGGVGVAEGYHRQPEMTAERFMRLPALQRLAGQSQAEGVTSAGRYYQSGDLVKWNADGQLLFLGRADDQVKVRGFRIELGEIESQLLQQVEVQACVVIVDQDKLGEPRIIAYVVSKQADQRLDSQQLRDRLRQRLPEFMVPNGFVQLSELPLSPTGKVDKRALPSVDQQAEQHHLAGVALQLATDPLQQKISLIWQQVLGLEQVDVTQNFFDLGGHSMKLAQVRNQLHQQLQRDVPLLVLFQYPTIERLAAYLRDAEQPVSMDDNKADEQKQRQREARQRLLQQRNRLLPKR
jgi:amino acid adenylation domain-containing protein